MIFIGTMNWASTKMSGMFSCPQCQSTEKFRLRASRPFLTLYFIPVLPIGGLEEFVQCSGCKNTFETVVLGDRLQPSQAVSGREGLSAVPFEVDLISVLALMMLEDGHVSENEIRIARQLYGNIAEDNLSRDELGAVCAQMQQRRMNTTRFLTTAAARRNHQEKLLLVQAMFGVAAADGEITDGRMNALLKTRELLNLHESEFQQAIANTNQWLA
ncbi:MAG: TerB family tellurite resistance protein [Planctomycetales bacterium]|nr:TerB family tellurite resistance protein [Planctomycetales bacterium]